MEAAQQPEDRTRARTDPVITPRTDREKTPPEPRPSKPPFWSRIPVILVGTLLLGVGAFYAVSHLAYSAAHEETDDAFVEAHVVSIGPKVSGIVSAVHVVDNQMVTNGQLLFEIDPRDYQARLAQKKATAASAEANRKTYIASFELMRNRLETSRASAAETKAEAEASGALATRGALDLQRSEQLRSQNVASAAELDAARATAQNAAASFTAAKAKAAADASRVTEAEAQLEAARNLLATASAQKEQAAAELESAQFDVSYATLAAPSAGRVTRKAVERGSYVQVGQRVCALVPTNVWVIGNFKETQLAKMRVGQPASIHIDAFPSREYRGHVESVQAGSGARFSLLPPENAVGNFVKVVQRVPVKLVFDEPLDTPNAVGPGMSVVPSVQVSGHPMAQTIVILIAVGIALVIGVLWLWLARRKAA